MVRNEEKYQLATHYRKRGFTYSDIAKLCQVSPATLSAWFRHKRFSKQVTKDNTARAAKDNAKRIGMLNKARKAERTARYAEAVRSAETEYKHYTKDSLFIAGVMIYRTVGDMRNEQLIRLATSDTETQRIFCKFVQVYLGVEADAIKFWLLLYPTHDETVCQRAWQKILKVKPAQFHKTQVIQGKSTKQPLQFGVLNTIIGNTVLKKKLNRWIELALTEL